MKRHDLYFRLSLVWLVLLAVGAAGIVLVLLS